MDNQSDVCCSKCGTPIKNIYIIDNKPYGSECATAILGLKTFPTWYKGGDWNKAKAKFEATAKENQIAFEKRREITANAWEDYMTLSIATKRAYAKCDEWGCKFIQSIMSQLGFGNYIACTDFDTMEEAEKNWKEFHGSFPYLYHEPKKISSLSEKQQNILNKFI